MSKSWHEKLEWPTWITLPTSIHVDSLSTDTPPPSISQYNHRYTHTIADLTDEFYPHFASTIASCRTLMAFSCTHIPTHTNTHHKAKKAWEGSRCIVYPYKGGVILLVFISTVISILPNDYCRASTCSRFCHCNLNILLWIMTGVRQYQFLGNIEVKNYRFRRYFQWTWTNPLK